MKEKPVRRRTTQSFDEVTEAANSEDESVELDILGHVDRDRLIPTGSTLLNLALSGDPYGGFVLGTTNNIIGDSQAGKTLLLWSCFAEMTYNERFDEHEIDYDEPESAFAFDVSKLWGEQVEERVVTDTTSASVEEFHDNVLEMINKGKPFIWGLDSLDAICDEDEIDRDIRKGSFGGKKPKLVGEILRKITEGLKNTSSTLFVISQTRDNIGVSFGNKKTRSGGKALKFFSTHELWMAVVEHIKRKDLDVGVLVRCKISKNKVTGRVRIVEFPIYYDYGIDDITSCVDFLMENKRWKKAKEEKEDKKKSKAEALKKAAEEAKDEEGKKKKVKGLIDTDGDIYNKPILYDALIFEIAKDPELKKKLVKATAEEWYKREEAVATTLPPKYPRQ